MVVVTLPGKTVDYVGLIGLMKGASGTLPAPDAPLAIHVEDRAFITPSALTWLCAFCVRRRQLRAPVRFRGSRRALGYLARMDLLSHAGVGYEETFDRHDETGRFLALRLVEEQSGVFPRVNALCDLVAHHFDNAREFLPALEWAANEILDNVFVHAESPTPAVVYAQHYANHHRLSVAIADQGRGLRASLAEQFQLFGHGDAIGKALERGVTRIPGDGAGNGMAGTLAISEANGGTMWVATGDVQFKKPSGTKHGFRNCGVEVPGTTIELSLDTKKPVALKDTFLGDGTSMYFSSLVNLIDEGRPVVVRDWAVNTEGPEPARALRHRLEVVLHDPAAVVALDFTGVQSASTTFLDELLGHLCARYGRDRLLKQLRIHGASESLVSLANEVMEKRSQGHA
jgi:hypothetical protein